MTEPAPSRDRRLLLVHAHPDDESINNGATMAKYAAEGARVTLVTCTLGEEGEVIPPALAHLAPDRDDALGPHRIGELRVAMRELGVADHRFLGGAGRYRDSGMMGAPQNDRPECFWRAPVDEAAALLVDVIRETRPQVLVTYGPDGGYGHPDHIQAHRVAVRAAELAADPAFRPEAGRPHRVTRTYWNCVPRSDVRPQAFAGNPFPLTADPADVPGVVDDAEVAVRIDGGPRYVAAKAAAMAAHATQVTVDGTWFALSNHLGQPLHTVECYRLPDGQDPPAEPHDDLFAGVFG
ncbi:MULTISPECIES: N-acetyl-1-D-myo-inositol-2-amino-2-deoxy-alpha-D-glucopyranoside deacetylase [unclassified Streptomyces]|uniref:N-acetyl-1-D-myo-inositol-2-amino-2-deoxy-alpha- D-glucopyranoside deacetylase n=1 Tax=unclassified Streptomyces TaxID=2593676 RepID=UPI0022B65B75|nr:MULTISPECIES: N-acetyl-1-D-myo-inositol-2-amino-2-deoxy-alpha-D-glucopyranoside deacetylase [unclassified Streptomyces]MCZ7416717.1 N-acetyl-1-D-myo-inositol-2-amino-2-deoxy-alpha-D-glucopyranoside deacetylase [Streptomyces sp. WMMC897]MCZ7433473.1 N-acetyl-1-D-myo-inositol-2-amino-2-deoxy-alpha-D-glucopyranoside deacetylase [Streptomyces sp. WMMC1477]